MTTRTDFRHPAWCVRDDLDLDCRPEDRQIRHHGVEHRITTERATTITARICWTEFMTWPDFDPDPEVTVPQVVFDGEDGSPYEGAVHELQGGDGAIVGALLIRLADQITSAGWWAPTPAREAHA